MLPIKFNGWDEADIACVILYNVEFLENFGQIEKGKKYQSAFINYGMGFIDCYKDCEEEGIEVTVKFKSVALD